MSTQSKVKIGPVDHDEESHIAEYLKNHPNFFERHAGLLAHLTLPHQTGGSAISLVERQTAIMRHRNEKLDKKLKELVQVARTNQELSDKTHTLTVRLMNANSIEEVLDITESTLRQDFGSERAAMVLFLTDDVSANLVSNNFVRRIAPTDAALKPFGTFLEGSKPRCGQIRDAQKEFLFGPDNMEIGSAALLPLKGLNSLGMLAIGNQNAHHFHPAMSTDFLVRLAESISAALQRFQ